MKQPHKGQTVTFRYILITLLAVLVTWILHEFAHWATGEVLGYNMVMTLNASYPENAKYYKDGHEPLISIAGPLITLIQAAVCYFIIKRHSDLKVFPFLLTCFYMRLLAGGLNFVNLNDEGRVSNYLEIGTFTVPLIVIAILSYLNYNAVKILKLRTRFILFTILWIMLFSSILILSDQAFKLQIIK